MLPHRRAVDGGKCQPRQRIRVGAVLHQKYHARAIEAVGAVFGDRAVGADPELLPLPELWIVGIEALPLTAVAAGPVLQQRAAPAYRLDDAAPDGRARFGRDVPLT